MFIPKALRDFRFRFHKKRHSDITLFTEGNSSYAAPLPNNTDYNSAPIPSGSNPRVYMTGHPEEYAPLPGFMEVPEQVYQHYESSGPEPRFPDRNEFHHTASELSTIPTHEAEVQYEDSLMTEELFEEHLTQLSESQEVPTISRVESIEQSIPVMDNIGHPQDFFEQQQQMYDQQFQDMQPDLFEYHDPMEDIFQAQEALFNQPLEQIDPHMSEPFTLEDIIEAESNPIENVVMDDMTEVHDHYPVPLESMEPYMPTAAESIVQQEPVPIDQDIMPQEMIDPNMQDMYDPQMQAMMDPYMMPGAFGPMGPGGPGL